MSATIEDTPDFLAEPSYLPRISRHDGRAIEEALAATLFDSGVRLRAAVIEASYAATDSPLLKRLRDEQVPTLIDLQTQRFTSPRFLEVEALAELPYAPSEPISAEAFEEAQAQGLARDSLLFQQGARCNHYLTAGLPFYDQDLQRWVGHNDRLLEASCSANGGADVDRRPLIAQVAPGRKAMMHPQLIVNRLLDYPIAGAYVQPLAFNPVTDSPEKLKLYLEFLLSIRSEGIPVIASRVGAFGLVLGALGITAFDSGLAQAEATNLAQLNRVPTEKERERRAAGKGGGPDKRIYLEALKTTLKGAHANAILAQRGLRGKFVCTHGCCQYRGFEDLADRRRQHFLWTRDAEVAGLRACPTDGLRRDFVTEQLRDAQETARVVRRSLLELGSAAPRFEHLDRWISLLASEQAISASSG